MTINSYHSIYYPLQPRAMKKILPHSQSSAKFITFGQKNIPQLPGWDELHGTRQRYDASLENGSGRQAFRTQLTD
jgi:hypothetical protein